MAVMKIFRVSPHFMAAATGWISANPDAHAAAVLPITDGREKDAGHQGWLPAHHIPAQGFIGMAIGTIDGMVLYLASLSALRLEFGRAPESS